MNDRFCDLSSLIMIVARLDHIFSKSGINILTKWNEPWVSLKNSNDFKFPIGKDNLFMLHNFNHKDYHSYIGHKNNISLNIGDKKVHSIFDL